MALRSIRSDSRENLRNVNTVLNLTSAAASCPNDVFLAESWRIESRAARAPLLSDEPDLQVTISRYPHMHTRPTGFTTLETAIELIRRPSITPEDGGCQEFMIERLEASGFSVDRLPFGEVSNFWARRGTAEPVFTFAGHTDVVPPGPDARWDSPPFEPTVRDGTLFGRGAADMKGGLAAMLVATERFVAAHPDHRGSLAFLVTSAEEAMFENGTPRVVEALEQRQEKIRWCIVGEPSSEKVVGDVLKIGRRGALTGHLRILGLQGHVAFPHLANNAAHRALPVLTELTRTQWDAGNKHFPATSFQIANLHAGTGVDNVIPGELEVAFSFRYSSESSAESLKTRVEAMLKRHELDFELSWRSVGEPFLTQRGELLDAAVASITQVTGRKDIELSTAGGTSDGRFIAPTGAQVIELGPSNATIHQANESVDVEELERLALVYEDTLQRLMS